MSNYQCKESKEEKDTKTDHKKSYNRISGDQKNKSKKEIYLLIL